MNPLLIPNPIHLVHLQVDQAPKWTFSAHNDSFLPQAFMTLSLPGSFLRYRESLLSWELKDRIGTTLNQRRMGVGGIVLQLSHHLVGQFWSLSYTVPQRVPKGIEAQMPTVVNHRLMLLLLTFLPSLSHFPRSFTCASWKHLPNTFPGPKLLEKGLLWGETQPAQPLLFKDLTFLQNSHGRSYILTFLDSFVVRIYNIGSNNQVSLWEFITQRSRACASSILAKVAATVTELYLVSRNGTSSDSNWNPISACCRQKHPDPGVSSWYQFLPQTDFGLFPGFSGALALFRSSHKFLFCFSKPEFIFCGLKPNIPTDTGYVLLMYKNNKATHGIVCQRRILETS